MFQLSVLPSRIAGAVALIAFAGAASAQTHSDVHAQTPRSASSAPDAGAISSGQVMEVSKKDGTLTIQHGPLANLNMSGMTMIFRAADPAMLMQVKAGDKIRFRAEDVKGELTVTKLELAR